MTGCPAAITLIWVGFVALDVRPREGARWLEDHGAAYDLYPIYDNEWWHFEHRPECAGTPPRRLPHPGYRLETVGRSSA